MWPEAEREMSSNTYQNPKRTKIREASFNEWCSFLPSFDRNGERQMSKIFVKL